MDLDKADVDLDEADMDLDGADTGLDGTDMDVDDPVSAHIRRNSLAASFDFSAYFSPDTPNFQETNFQERAEDQKHGVGSQIASVSSLMTEDSLAPMFQGGADVPMPDAWDCSTKNA
ncbi:hypothetical protein GYMLUDRAFT_260549 [Collybiopsis luxurians FD-317 M1]|uniref:Uncharacterized protein n=1 Tax=Collybiopsis luxurians FD-317 M1 TaxID=944289 RepID=A0A0D0BE63_9AGAR|nr:hypothetical protein GYMLUDRAFT_260549 [Collybiopsis luxurians FD-317 M1]